MTARSLERLVAVAAGVALLASACGEEGGSDATPTGSVEVTAIDIAYEPADYTAEAGNIEITLVQDGQSPHDLVFEGRSDVHLEVGPDNLGDTDTGVFEFDPGTYTFFCTLAGHRQAGMEGTLTVTES